MKQVKLFFTVGMAFFVGLHSAGGEMQVLDREVVLQRCLALGLRPIGKKAGARREPKNRNSVAVAGKKRKPAEGAVADNNVSYCNPVAVGLVLAAAAYVASAGVCEPFALSELIAEIHWAARRAGICLADSLQELGSFTLEQLAVLHRYLSSLPPQEIFGARIFSIELFREMVRNNVADNDRARGFVVDDRR